jgi:acyl-coenzyme A synthetase/AMP-(fatty) acid ligase
MLTPEDLAQMVKDPPFWSMGMTETLAPYAVGREVRAEGRPLAVPIDYFAPGYDVRVVGDDGEPVADGGIGEIQVRGYPVAPALHKIERAEGFTPDGFYRTGDLAQRDGARFHFVGRGGDMIKTAGANVSPAEVEEELMRLPGVHSAYVLGLPDEARGQLVVAAVVAREDAALDTAAIEGELRKRLSSYKVPRAYLEIAREEVPMMHSNKVYRRELARIVAERLGRTAP